MSVSLSVAQAVSLEAVALVGRLAELVPPEYRPEILERQRALAEKVAWELELHRATHQGWKTPSAN